MIRKREIDAMIEDLNEDDPPHPQGKGEHHLSRQQIGQRRILRVRRNDEDELEEEVQENELAEKRAAKLEKERKREENQNKSRSIMSAFFSKSKTSNKLLRGGSTSKITSLSDPSSSKSEFDRAFKPYTMKKNAKMAPINFFRSQPKTEGVIDLDEESSASPSSCVGPKIDTNDNRDQNGINTFV